MKRSEMINLISNYFYENGVDAEKSMDEADTLLTAIELRGMVPPLRKSTPDDFVNIGFTQDFLEEHDFKTNGWEDEEDLSSTTKPEVE